MDGQGVHQWASGHGSEVVNRQQLTFDGLVADRSDSAPESAGQPEGLTFEHDVLTALEEQILLRAIDDQPWITSMSRRVQH